MLIFPKIDSILGTHHIWGKDSSGPKEDWSVGPSKRWKNITRSLIANMNISVAKTERAVTEEEESRSRHGFWPIFCERVS